MKILYRYEIEYMTYDDETTVRLREYPVIRETENSYFIDPKVISIPMFAKKRVSKTAYNTFAFDTKEKAKEHFIRRTSKRIAWFEMWKEECEKGLKIIENE